MEPDLGDVLYYMIGPLLHYKGLIPEAKGGSGALSFF